MGKEHFSAVLPGSKDEDQSPHDGRLWTETARTTTDRSFSVGGFLTLLPLRGRQTTHDSPWCYLTPPDLPKKGKTESRQAEAGLIKYRVGHALLLMDTGMQR